MIMTKSQVVTTTVYSPILGIDWNYDAYLPAGYNDSTLSYPVLFMLHGLYGNHRNLLERFDSQQILDDLFVQTGHAMIVIFVDGFNSFYINAINGMAMEDAIMHDLVPAIFARYRILGGAGRHAIGGISMGGYGAARLALRYPDVFAHTALISPAIWEHIPSNSPFRQSLHAFTDGQTNWADKVYNAQLPVHDVHHGKGRVDFYVATSGDDQTVPVHDVRDFVTVLQEVGIPTVYVQDQGFDHGWAYWQMATPLAYRWVLAHVTH
ncbi:MAG TPA: esterase [Lactobacillus sp.]|nr:esterase [Lactobacillus sp.]